MTAIQGSAAAVTGAASGIGRALALELAARGSTCAGRPRRGRAAGGGCRDRQGWRTQGERASRGCWLAGINSEFATAATAAHPKLNILINNAGVALLGQFNEIEQAQTNGLLTSTFGAWCMRHGPSCHICRNSPPRISSTSPRFLASSPRPARPPIARQSLRCAAFPKACGMSLRWRTVPCGFGRASWRRAHQHRPQLPHRRWRDRQCPPLAIDRAL